MLTAKQHQTYQFIRHHILRFGIAPTIREIAGGLGLKSAGVAHRHTQALVTAGLIFVDPFKNRAIQLNLENAIQTSLIPLIGEIKSQQRVEIEKNTVNMLDISNLLLAENKCIYVANDDSLRAFNICRGDYLLGQDQQSFQANDMVLIILRTGEVIIGQLNDQMGGIYHLTDLANQLRQVPIKTVQVMAIYLGMLRLDLSKYLT